MAQIRRLKTSSGGAGAAFFPLLVVALLVGFFGGYHKGHQDGYSKKIVDRVRSMDTVNDDLNSSPDASLTQLRAATTSNTSSSGGQKECDCSEKVSEAVASAEAKIAELEKKSASTATAAAAAASTPATSTATTATAISERGEGEQDFLKIAQAKGTDKVAAHTTLPSCLENRDSCIRKDCVRPECRPWGHFYDTIYQGRLGHLSRDDTEPFQFLEIGFFKGYGFHTYKEFFPRAEAHSMEISCIEQGPREEGKWPWGNFASSHPNYEALLKEERLHCGDANDVNWLNEVWIKKMKRADAPPLKVVVDDGAHIDKHMAQTVFFWFPRIEPGGYLVVEDIMPIKEANKFRTEFLPQMMADLHYCGMPEVPDAPCFATLQPFLRSVHCEMHICIFERNSKPAEEMSLPNSTITDGVIDHTTCRTFQRKR